MKEEMTFTVMRRTQATSLPSAPSPAASKPGNGSGSPPSHKEQRDAINALAFSLDNLYGCIELINEGKSAPLMRVMRELERDIISQAMTMARANIRKAAVLLGIKYTTLYAKIKKHGLHFSKAIRFYTDGSGFDIGPSVRRQVTPGGFRPLP